MSRERTRVAAFNPFLYHPLLLFLFKSPLFPLLPKHNRIGRSPEKWPRHRQLDTRGASIFHPLSFTTSYTVALRKRLQIRQDDTLPLPAPLIPSLSRSTPILSLEVSLLNGVTNLFSFHGFIEQQSVSVILLAYWFYY